jgi:hypothetical protein
MIPIDENTQQSDAGSKGGYTDVAQPKPEIPDVVPHKPEIDHTDTDGVDRKEREPGTIYMGSNEGGKKPNDPQNVTGRDQTKPGQDPSQPTPDDASKDFGQRQGGGSGQQKQQLDPTQARP